MSQESSGVATVGVPKEVAEGEARVALVPESVVKLKQAGYDVMVQSGAGGGYHSDEAYEEAGARIGLDARQVYESSDILLKVQPPSPEELGMLHEGKVLIALLQPLINTDLVLALAERRITAFSMDAIPRIARAQSMDVLSSMSSIAGYKSVLIAASSLGKYMPMMMTAAGTIPPAKVLVLGAGVAGLQAIATARRLGAVVEAFDVRPVVKEQVESLGARFIEAEPMEEAEAAGGYAKELSEEHQRRERELIHRHVREADIVITTALVPGRRAPLLVTEEMVRDMRPGSVIVDLAAEAQGNVEVTVPGETVVVNGVTVHGPLNVPSTVPIHASQLFSRNISTFLLHLTKDGGLHLDMQDQITRDTCITRDGEVLHKPTLSVLEQKGMATQ